MDIEGTQELIKRATEKGYKIGVTEGYKKGSEDWAAIGYLTHIHDLFDVLEEMDNDKIKLTTPGILKRLEAIETIRKQTKIYGKKL